MKKAQAKPTAQSFKLHLIFLASLFFCVFGLLGYRLGAEWLFWPLIVNIVVLIGISLTFMPKMMAAVFGSIFLLALALFPIFIGSIYLLTVLPVVGDALRSDPPALWSVGVVLLVVLADIIVGGLLYIKIEKFARTKLNT